MANKNTATPEQSKISIIKTVQTPLGFFVLIVLIVEAILAAIVISKNVSGDSFLVQGMVALIFLLVGVVTFLAYKRPYALIPELERYWASLDFDGKSAKDMDFSKNGTWRVYSDDPANTEPVDKGELKLNFAPPGAWIWKLPISFQSNYSIEMEIIDDDNQTWLVNQRPNITLAAKRKKGG
jgi:hypothetical protein